jgi:hypothetical protein
LFSWEKFAEVSGVNKASYRTVVSTRIIY